MLFPGQNFVILYDFGRRFCVWGRVVRLTLLLWLEHMLYRSNQELYYQNHTIYHKNTYKHFSCINIVYGMSKKKYRASFHPVSVSIETGLISETSTRPMKKIRNTGKIKHNVWELSGMFAW